MKKPKRELQIIGKSEPVATTPPPSPILPDLNFDAWWLITQRRLGLKAELKDALKSHMKSRGYLDQSKFDDGLRDFGI